MKYMEVKPGARRSSVAIEGGDPPTRKALLQSLIEEIRVVSRAEIHRHSLCPWFDYRQGQCPGLDSNQRPPL